MLRLLILAVLLLGLIAIASYYDLGERVDVDAVRELVLSSGAYGWALYFAVFAAGEFLHVPGMVFVAAGVLIYGKIMGFAMAYLAAVCSVIFSFVLVRRIGGKPFGSARSPWLRKMLSHLEARPVRTIFLLRLSLWMAPALNYVLALTSVRLRHYAIGSALGLLPPLVLAAIFVEWLVELL